MEIKNTLYFIKALEYMRYIHTNIIARDWEKLSEFYKDVFECRKVPPQRNLKGEWLDRLTGIKDAHIEGVHLALPGYDDCLPTLEIFSYNLYGEVLQKNINNYGFSHIAFEIENVEETLNKIKSAGGGQVGEIVKTKYPNGQVATFVYATDIEGNIIELQSWD